MTRRLHLSIQLLFLLALLASSMVSAFTGGSRTSPFNSQNVSGLSSSSYATTLPRGGGGGGNILTTTTTSVLLGKRSSNLDGRIQLQSAASSSASEDKSTTNNSKDSDDNKLPKTIIPILLSVLALILSEGIALSTLPLHLQSMGATPTTIGLSTSAFSIAQMVCCPLLVKWSATLGRTATLRVCLLGAALSSTLIASAQNIPLILVARFAAGAFASSIPIAQAGVTDLVKPHQTAMALSQVSAASQTGLVIGPIASALVQGILISLGVPSSYLVRAVFASSAAFALVALLIGTLAAKASQGAAAVAEETESSTTESNTSFHLSKESPSSAAAITTDGASDSSYSFLVQPSLRSIALLAGWALTLSVSTYSMFSSKFLGYAQTQLSGAMSTGAAVTILTQILLVPRLVPSLGTHLADSVGLAILSAGLLGTSLIRVQPIHSLFYLLIRVGTGIVDTATATLVATYSKDRQERGTNLGMIQSTRAGARIFTPVISGSLFARSCAMPRAPGSLPYLVNAACCLALIPLPLFLKRKLGGSGGDDGVRKNMKKD
ncbi:unnamed protein product [Cylindrotheca closterium]|uniref:Major facilitator superfamily (MFS) profile domain-containing protein n=1 Tax=Cylindrotheca closterium TaxID=2856 RepID=A0AAD2G1F0_9STRA|nr:unnamed protein product [Cylindrotheca closterium]